MVGAAQGVPNQWVGKICPVVLVDLGVVVMVQKLQIVQQSQPVGMLLIMVEEVGGLVTVDVVEMDFKVSLSLRYKNIVLIRRKM
jgi:hypothetical protein